MIDDSLSDTQQSFTSYRDNEGFPIPTYHCAVCKTTTEGFNLCLKCNPQTYKVSDTQQEKMMSVRELAFECDCGSKLVIKFENEELKFLDPIEFLALTRNEAHFLMLYLQEHLNAK